jgi:LuxR family transcriptional regulator, maltose regulon positive regulatory protein
MPAPIVATKLFVPAPRPRAVARPRIVEALIPGRSLTLVSAPAGFGKTTLVVDWAARCGRAVAWLSLDERDGDLPRFLLYLAAALNKLDPAVGADVMAALESPQPPSTDAVLSDLINEIDGGARDILLVLDDYHVVVSPAVDQALAFVLDHLPRRLQLAIATREDPNLPLARLRARGELAELRAADLRFTPAEAAEFLGRTMGLSLSAEHVAALEGRTEGWIAGLQLAALSMQGEKDVARFIESFAGSHRFVLDYLADEVLRRQPEDVEDFLLRTSVLDRLCGPLCDALTRGCAPQPGGSSSSRGGQEMLEHLERANLFIVPLDDQRKWYRYHRLFAELLRQRLGRRDAASSASATLHVRASEWFEHNGLDIEAFLHAAAAGDIDRAERLAGSRAMPIHFRGALISILDWLASLPASLLDARPSLRVLAAAMSLVAGRSTGVDAMLDAAQRGLQRIENGPLRARLTGRIAAARATLALSRYQPDAIMEHSSRALEILPDDDLGFRFTALWTQGFAHFLRGDRDTANRRYADALAVSQASGDAFSMQLSLCSLGRMQELDARLHLAAGTYRQALVLFGDHPHPNANEPHLGLARIFYEWNRLDEAEAAGERSLGLAQQYDPAVDRFILCELVLARIASATGRLDAAARRLDGLASAARSRGFLHRLPEIVAQQVRVLLRLGDLGRAAQLADAAELPLSRARVLLARGEAHPALTVLEAERARLTAMGWRDELLAVKVLQALALRAMRREDEALDVVGDVMKEVEAEGFTRLFVDEGRPMADLLATAAARGIMPAGCSRLLAAFAAERPSSARTAAPAGAPLAQGLVEPLSERELEVLGLVARGLSNQEIGERLFIALDTVKGHNRRIFEKLDVKRRTEAIARARELRLLQGSP